MSKLDKTKTIIDVLKTIAITLLVALFGMLSYAFIHSHTLDKSHFIGLGIAIIANVIALVIIAKVMAQHINELEEL
jgi:hypothetical protein